MQRDLEQPFMDELVFTNGSEKRDEPRREHRSPWNILIVDDEKDMHVVTTLVLQDLTYNGRPVRLHHAFSASEAKELLVKHADIALILLDVVMETDDAGLALVEYIRNDLKNKMLRIVLRTGQPGQAPERRVIHDYDINDYKSKTEFTATKLYTTALTALRAYEDIVAVEMSRRGLEKILSAAASLFQERSMQLFASGVLTQISGLLGLGGDEGVLCVYETSFTESGTGELYVLAGAGEFETINGALLDTALALPVADSIIAAMRAQRTLVAETGTALYFETPSGKRIVIYLASVRTLTAIQMQLLQVFCQQVSVALDNLHMYADLARAHEELKLAHVATVVMLADVAELRDPETGAHVLRVARMSENIARILRERSDQGIFIDDEFIEAIGLASIMHDVGKVTTPDNILQKPGRLTQEEREVMQRHAGVGRELLEKASTLAPRSAYLSLGAEIAGGHHEWFDGTGYPRGIEAHAIPLSARIVAIADVFDALTHSRVYKRAWTEQEAIAYIEERSGTQFDPEIVQAFLRVTGVRS